MPPCNCHPPFPRPEPFSPLPRPGKVPDWGKWIRDRLAEKGALLVFPTRAMFPEEGAWPNLYLDRETGAVYRWENRTGYAVLVDPREGNDVLVYDSVAAFPDEGEPGKLYIAANAGSLYRWGGEGYVALLPGKADKVVPQAVGNFAGLNGSGNLTDSGKKPADFATAEQGAKADTAVQPEDLPEKLPNPQALKFVTTAVGVYDGYDGSEEKTLSHATDTRFGLVRLSDRTDWDRSATNGAFAATPAAVKTVNDKVTAVEGKIPAQASSSNQLADKEFVNSSVATNTATFRGTFNLVTDLQLPLNATHEQVAAAVKTELGQADYDGSDYVYVQIPQDLEHTDAMKQVDRYKCVETGADPVVKSWEYEWTLNNSSFTAAQWAAINSGITGGDVAKLAEIEAGAQVNVIETVKVNGMALVPDEHKAVDVVLEPLTFYTGNNPGTATTYDGSVARTIYKARQTQFGLVRLFDGVDNASAESSSVAATPNAVRRVRISISPNYFAANVQYNPEDYVYAEINGNLHLYRCIEAHKGAWNAAHFTQESVTEALKRITTSLNAVSRTLQNLVTTPAVLATAAGVPNATTLDEVRAALGLAAGATVQDAIDAVSGVAAH